MTKQEKLRKVINVYTDGGCLYPDDGKGLSTCDSRREGCCISYDDSYKCLMKRLDELGVVIKGNSLGASHPHLVNYFTVEPLVKDSKC